MRTISGNPSGSLSNKLESDDTSVRDLVGWGAFLALLGYTTVEFARLQQLVGLNASWFRPALYLMVIIVACWVKRWGLKAMWSDRLLVYFGIFIALGVAWIPFAVNNFWAFHATRGLAQYFLAATVPLTLFLVSAKRRNQFFAFWMLLGLYLSLFVIVNGGQGPGGVLQDENDMAFMLCMMIPYPYFLAKKRDISKLVRLSLYGLTAIIVAAIVATHSRGGFLGFACVLLYMCYLSRHRVRNFLICAVLGIVALQFVPDTYVERIGTITDAQDTSRTSRLTSWLIASKIFLENPVFGVGPRNFPFHSGPIHVTLESYQPGDAVLAGRAAHSLYFTLLPEYGIVGTVLFFVMILNILRRLTSTENVLKRRLAGVPDDHEAENQLLLNSAIKASMIGYLSAGAFISVLYYPQLWYTIGFVIALHRDVVARFSPAPDRVSYSA